jgi:hypothetical protein
VSSPYVDILTTLAAEGVRFVVAGGVAVVLHGVERLTMDIDVAVEMTPENLQSFLGVMRDLGLRPRVPVPPEILLDPAGVARMVQEKGAVVFTFVDPQNPLKQVDVFLAPHLAYPLLVADSLQLELCGHRIRIASIAKLLELKRQVEPPRSKDLHDIAELEKLQEDEQ